MSAERTLPFKRGETYFGSGTPSTSVGTELEGQVYWTTDTVNSTPQPVKLRIMRNTSGIALAAGRLVVYESLDLGEADGYGRLNPIASGGASVRPVDDAYGSNTVQANDLFYVVEEGPCKVRASLANMASDAVPGTFLVCATAATSGATTAGRFVPADFSGATSVVANQIMYVFGMAISTALTNSTNQLTLCSIGRW